MKTNTIKTAALTLAMVISVSVNAQNTKSFKEHKLTTMISNLLNEDFTNLKSNLKAAIQYNPETNFNYAESDASETTMIDLSELESAAKFYPSTFIETENTIDNNDLSTIMEELKEQVKYQPNKGVNESDNLFKEIKSELAAVVRFIPES